jgi:hypothetical protein
VTFELDANLTQVIDCNCSLCRRRGALWHGAPAAHLRIVKGRERARALPVQHEDGKALLLQELRNPPLHSPAPGSNRWAVNVRCLDDVDLSSLKIRQFDGEHWEDAAKTFFESPGRGAAKPER